MNFMNFARVGPSLTGHEPLLVHGLAEVERTGGEADPHDGRGGDRVHVGGDWAPDRGCDRSAGWDAFGSTRALIYFKGPSSCASRPAPSA